MYHKNAVTCLLSCYYQSSVPIPVYVSIFKSNNNVVMARRCSSQRISKRQMESQYQKDCKTLNLPENCDQAQLRESYINLVKRFHPDSDSLEASRTKFQEIDDAYRSLLKKFADERHNHHKIDGEYGLYYQPKQKEQETEEDRTDKEEPTIKHTVPQHRQYLNFDGVGSGTPLQREKQYQKFRAAKAVNNVLEHRLKEVSKQTGSAVSDTAMIQRAAKKIKTGIGIERLVEDLIQEAMSRGDFDNLSGEGKPLKHDSSHNPYIDFATHKLNQVLIENGFTPEWIQLAKEIREETSVLRRKLAVERHSYNETLTEEEQSQWEIFLSQLKDDCDNLNKMILKYNLVVPSLNKQLTNFQLEREASKSILNYSKQLQKMYEKEAESRFRADSNSRAKNVEHSDSNDFIGMLISMFKI